MLKRRVVLFSRRESLKDAVHSALDQSGILARVKAATRVALKPNLTYPYHKSGITTSPEVLRETISILRDFTSHIAIVESDGGYGVWTADEAFAGHGFSKLRDEFGVKLVNLCTEAREPINVSSRGRTYQVPLPTRLLHETDLFITLPVPKIHSMTGLTLSHKNQWGCVPDTMRLRSHYIFNDAIVAINRRLKPMVLGDGTYFLDRNGPMDGDPVRMDLIIAATDPGAFDLYLSELMGFSWKRVPHLKRAVELDQMPASLDEITFNVDPRKARTHTFRLDRTLRTWIALTGFKSRSMTWFGYESWFGKVVLHGILYAIVGRPVKPNSNVETP
jgi:uncharacterized protein (DUF362 family)